MASNSSNSLGKKKMAPPTKGKKVSAHVAMIKTPREVEILDSGSEAGSEVVREEAGISWLNGARIIVPDTQVSFVRGELVVSVKFPGMAPVEEGGSGLVVHPKGFTSQVLYPCSHQEISEEEFMALHDADQCRCTQSEAGQIYYMPEGANNVTTTSAAGGSACMLNACLANTIKLANGAKPNCDYVIPVSYTHLTLPTILRV